MPKANWRKQCSKCGRTKADYDFFKYKTLPGEPEKWHDMCKQCLTMHIDNWNPNTYTWILQEMNFPYVESEWIKTRDKECEKAGPEGLNGLSVLGKYCSKMRMNQFKDKYWADTEAIKEHEQEVIAESQELLEAQKEIQGDKIAEMEEKYKMGEITKEQFESFMETYTSAPIEGVEIKPKFTENPIDEKALAAMQSKKGGKGINPFQVTEPLHKDLDIPDMENELSKEDKLYLCSKWGDCYTANEWVQLEKSYNDYMNSFDIQGAAREEQLKTICETHLKAENALRLNDYEGFQKLNKMYIDLQKAAKFTEAQNKEEKDDIFDSLGEMIRMCEAEGGFIPVFDTSSPKDDIDYAIADMNNYTKNLITNELGFGNLIEAQLKKIAQEQQESSLDDLKTENELEEEEKEELETTDEDEFKRALFGEDYQDVDPQVEEEPGFDPHAELHKYDEELKKKGG